MIIQWTIGNTTVRNPKRLKAGLALLKAEFEGQPWDYNAQRKFLERLIDEGLYAAGKAKTSDQREQHGRTWGSVLNELGLIFAYRSSGELQITPVGNTLLDEKIRDEEVYLRQLLKYQLPNPLPTKHGPRYEGVSVLPFLVALKMVKELDGISKEEMSIFLFTTTSMSSVDGQIQEVIRFRESQKSAGNREARGRWAYRYHINKLATTFSEELNERYQLIEQLYNSGIRDTEFFKSINGLKLTEDIVRTGKGANTNKAQHFSRILKVAIQKGEKLGYIKEIFKYYYIGIKKDTLEDYGDLNFRYLRLSGLFTARGNKMVLSMGQLDLVNNILAINWSVRPLDSNFLEDWFWNPNEPRLPSDDRAFLHRRLTALQVEQINLRQNIKTPLPIAPIIKEVPKEASTKDLKFAVYQLEDQENLLKEFEYYEKMQQPESIDEIYNYYDLILGGELLGGNRPAHFEWNTWRGFLAINRLSCFPHESRNFSIDVDMMPTDFAVSNKPDMNFTYDDFKLVVEVTLTRGANQWSAEGEPVPRHVARIQVASAIPTLCIFIAPQIDVNTAIEFYSFLKQRPYYIAANDQRLNLVIIPLTLEQWRNILMLFKVTGFTPQELRLLLEDLARHDSNLSITDGSQWIVLFPEIIQRWQKGIESRSSTYSGH